eukprot:1161877-Pelagomonas_calceolata.AAC.3
MIRSGVPRASSTALSAANWRSHAHRILNQTHPPPVPASLLIRQSLDHLFLLVQLCHFQGRLAVHVLCSAVCFAAGGRSMTAAFQCQNSIQAAAMQELCMWIPKLCRSQTPITA